MSKKPPDRTMERRLAAILLADVGGYSRLMGADEVGTVQALKAHRDAAVNPAIAKYRGHIVRVTGDGILVEFTSAVDSVLCAIDIQRGMAERNISVPSVQRIEFRIGINVGDIIFDDGDIQGDGVNIAARLEAMAEPGGICVSLAVRDLVRDKLSLDFEDLGEVAAKNIARPIHVFRVRPAGRETIPELPTLTISLINGIGLSFQGREVRLPNRKARALLAYLALNNPPEEQRERVTGLLWSESEQDKANTALRQVVHETRGVLKAVGYDAFQSTRSAIGLTRDSFQVDITSMLATPCNEQVVDLLLRQPRISETFLGGYEDLDPAFHEWLISRRQLLHNQILRGLEKGYRDDNQPRRQRRMLAEAALLQDPTHEDACRVIMRCAAEDGETGAALRAYDTLYRLLGSEHDMEPSGPTQELVAEIKQGKYDRIASQPAGGEGQTDPIAPAGSSLIRAGPYAEATRGGPPWIAVMPFRALGPDPVPSWFAEGLVEDIVRMLAGLREPIVISSNSTRMFRDIDFDPRRIERELGVGYVVSGTARRTGQALRLSVELADTLTGAVLWARAYDAQEDMLFEAQDKIVAEVVNTLAPRVHEAELRQLRLKRPTDLSAYHLTLEAKDLIFRLERTSFEHAGEILRRAIARDPGYAAAHAAMAGWYSLRLGQGWSPDSSEDTLALNRSVQSAVSLDSGNARALALLGHGKTIYERNHAEGALLSEQALNAAPNDAEVWLWSSPTYAYMGEADEAVGRAERARLLSPQDPFIFRTYHFLCIAHYSRKAYEEAAHWGELSYRANPRYSSNLRLTAACMTELGRHDEARALAAGAMTVEPRFRATDMLSRFPFRDVTRREQYVRQLVDAGMPA